MISRLFRIVYILLSEKSTTATKLAKEFETSTRTIYRDIERLNEAGVPIYTERGTNGGIYLLDDYTFNKSVITEEQKKSLLASIDLLCQIDYSSDKDAIKGLTNLLGREEHWIEVDFSTWANYEENYEEIFLEFKNAIFGRKLIEIDYVGQTGDRSKRKIKPLKLVFKNHSWYLYAFCLTRNDYRFFKLSRIVSHVILNETFEPIEVKYVKAKYVNDQSRPKYRVVIDFDKEASYRVYDDFRDVIKLDNGVRVIYEIDDIDWLIGYLMTYGNHAYIVEPKEIKERFLLEIDKIKALYK